MALKRLGGGFGAASMTVPCSTCGTPAGRMCFEYTRYYPAPCAATGWMGTTGRYPSICAPRWDDYRRACAAAKGPREGDQLALM